jgi:beta-N-acetylhexosaminidase
MDRLNRVELVPFRAATSPEVDVAAVMVGHLAYPELDPSGVPASISEPIVTGLLRDDLGYDGLVITDDLGAMAAITDNVSPRDAAIGAINAGADMLIVLGDRGRQRAMRDALVAALESGELDRGRVMEAVERVLTAKARFGLLQGERPENLPCPQPAESPGPAGSPEATETPAP